MRLYVIVMIDRLKNIKLVVSDIDGTLLTSDNHLHPTTLGAIQFFEKNPVCKFTFSTGRSILRVKPMAELFNLQVPYIFSGGAIFDPKNGRSSYQKTLQREQIEKVQKIAENAGVGLIAHTTGKMFCQMNDKDWDTISNLEWLKDRHIEIAKRVDKINIDAEIPVLRVDIFSEDKDLIQIYQELNSDSDGLYPVPMKRSIEITPQGVDKGSALLQLVEYLDISVENVLAIGDSLNDVRLLDIAGVGVAMGTAPDVLKYQADIVVPSSDEGGFAYVLDFLAWTNGI